MKIGILTLFHGNYNWGGVLQGYALKTFIESNFPDTKVDILIYQGQNIVYKSKIKQVLQYSPIDIVKKVRGKLKSNDTADYRKDLERRYELFRDFMEQNTTNPVAYNDETLVEAAKKYDCLIVGSDQVWNPNVGQAGFFLETVSDECKKISYAASIARDSLSGHERSVMLPLIKKFDAVSVREKTAKNIIEGLSKGEIGATEVLDPVMLLSTDDWNALAQKSSVNYEGKYALAFCFSESLEYRNQITEYCKENGLELKFIPFAKGDYIASDEKGEAERIYDVGPYEFVNLFKNSECIFTDSFHGSVFSIIFKKNFCVFERDKKSKTSKNSRLYDLLDKFELSDRMVNESISLNEVMRKEIDYLNIDSLHKQYKKDSVDFLARELTTCPTKTFTKKVHVADLEPEMCCGCEVCVTQCPKKCIEMKRDNNGFYFPVVDESLCIRCGKCLGTCTTNISRDVDILPKAFVGYHRDSKIRANSSSGGLFYALASKILLQGGCVYGAAYSEDLEVQHCRVADLDGLSRLMTSKYVQSRTEDVFLQVLEDLKSGRKVLFSGTPCQVAAMHGFIKDENLRQGLILVDFICHGVPSPGVWQSYLEYLKERNKSDILAVSFRDKCKGWHDFHFSAEFKRKTLRESHETNAYMRSFLSDKNIRKSCYQCAFKDGNYCSDITLGDAWKIEKDKPEWADDAGTSLFVARSSKGFELLNDLGTVFEYIETDYDKWTQYNPSLVKSTNMPMGRKAFFEDYQAKTPRQFWKSQKNVPLKKRVRYLLKKIVKFVGLDKKLRQRM